LTAKQNPLSLQAPDGSYYVTETDGSGNLVSAGAPVLAAGDNVIGRVKVTDGTNVTAVKPASTAAIATDPAVVTTLSPNSAGIVAFGQTTKANSVPVTVASDQGNFSNTPYPSGATPITSSATGTTAATVATLAGASSKTTYICGFTITADATAALAGAATVAGTISGSLNYIQSVGSATAAQLLTQSFVPPIPASATNTAITVTSAAAGTGGNTAVTAWGYQL